MTDTIPPLDPPPTRAELLWLWRKRHRYGLGAAARALGTSTEAYADAELRDDWAEVAAAPADLPAAPTPAEALRLRRRRSGVGRDALAARVGVSHVTWLKWERRCSPKLVEFWKNFTG